MFRQNESLALKNLIIPMGGYHIIHREAKGCHQLISPGVQACIVVVLISKTGIGLAHIDSNFNASDTLEEMIKELKNISKKEIISATLIGGDYGDPFFNSNKISNAICQTLKQNKIGYTHKDYNFHSSFIATATYFTAWMLNLAWPKSTLGAILISMLIYIAMKFIPVTTLNVDVFVDVKSGNISLAKNEYSRSAMLKKLGITNLPLTQQTIYHEREKTLITPKNKKTLTLFKVPESSAIHTEHLDFVKNMKLVPGHR